MSFEDISFRDEGFPDFILRRWLGGHVFETSFLPSLWPRRVSYSCNSCVQAQSFIEFVVHRHELGFRSPERSVPLCCFVSLLLRLFARLLVRSCVDSCVCLVASVLFFLTRGRR